MTKVKTQRCTNCKQDIVFDNIGSWRNVNTKVNKEGYYHCRVCAGKIGRANSSKKPTGRPKGSKNRATIVAWNKGKSDNIKNIGTLTHEQRMAAIAKRSGHSSYEEYRKSLPAWRAYRLDVIRVTNSQPLHLLENFDKRGVNGEEGAYTLDHIVSLKRGFKEGITPEQIGHIDNLQMLPWEENITKGWK